MLSADYNQQQAIEHRNGPALVIAGPGSGKTYVLTNHIHFLINQAGVPPEGILVITFTKAAALNMKARYLNHFGETNHIRFGTFHSVFYQFLKQYSVCPVAAIAGTKEKHAFMSIAIENTSFCHDYETIENLLLWVSMRKNRGDEEFSSLSLWEYREDFEKVFREYNAQMQEHHMMDYDDIIISFIALIKGEKQICSEIGKYILHVLIDEFQDINIMQYEAVKLISSKHQNVFAVGDDDQAIYSFRGANPGLMKAFLKDFECAVCYHLSINYRSDQLIVQMSEKVICENTSRLIKHNETFKKDEGVFSRMYFKNKTAQNDYVIKKVKESLRHNKRTVVLLRTNQDAARYRRLFTENKVYCNEDDHMSHQITESIAEDFLGYIRLSVSSKREYLFRIMNKPDRYLKRDMFVNPDIDWNKCIAQAAGRTRSGVLQKLKRDLDYLKGATPFAIVNYIRKVVGYEQFVQNGLTKENQKDANQFLDRLQEASKTMTGQTELVEYLLTYCHIADNKSTRAKADDENRMLQIMTLHAAKGLEFDTVILPDVNDEKIPGRTAYLPEAIEEERRLLYVGMTRAIHELVITAIKNEETQSSVPSRFIQRLESNKSI